MDTEEDVAVGIILVDTVHDTLAVDADADAEELKVNVTEEDSIAIHIATVFIQVVPTILQETIIIPKQLLHMLEGNTKNCL